MVLGRDILKSLSSPCVCSSLPVSHGYVVYLTPPCLFLLIYRICLLNFRLVSQFVVHFKDNCNLRLEVLSVFSVHFLPVLLFLLTNNTRHNVCAFCSKSALSPLSKATDFYGLSCLGAILDLGPGG